MNNSQESFPSPKAETSQISPEQLRRIDTILTRRLESEFGTMLFYSNEHGSFMPAKIEDINRILNYLKLKPGQKFTDLGSGDGRWLFLAALSKLQAEGYEADPLIYGIAQEAKTELLKEGILNEEDISRIIMENKDLFLKDVSQSDAIIYYEGSGAGSENVEKKILQEAKSGTKVVLYGHIPEKNGFKNLKILSTNDRASVMGFRIFEVPEK